MFRSSTPTAALLPQEGVLDFEEQAEGNDFLDMLLEGDDAAIRRRRLAQIEQDKICCTVLCNTYLPRWPRADDVFVVGDERLTVEMFHRHVGSYGFGGVYTLLNPEGRKAFMQFNEYDEGDGDEVVHTCLCCFAWEGEATFRASDGWMNV